MRTLLGRASSARERNHQLLSGICRDRLGFLHLHPGVVLKPARKRSAPTRDFGVSTRSDRLLELASRRLAERLEELRVFRLQEFNHLEVFTLEALNVDLLDMHEP